MKRWIFLSLAVLTAFCTACGEVQPVVSLSTADFVPAVREYRLYTDEGSGYTLEIPTELNDPTIEPDGSVRFASEAGDLICTVQVYAGDETPAQLLATVPFQYGDVTQESDTQMVKIGVGDALDGLMACARTDGRTGITVAYAFDANRMEASQAYFNHAIETLTLP